MNDINNSAVYYQKSRVVQEEFLMIEVATERENISARLQRIIRDVKEKRKDCDDNTILQTFKLFNQLRDVTYRFLKSVQAWQHSFTRPIRPTIFSCDYIVERLLKQIDFINSSKMRKIFNFQFFRGNILLLPYPNTRIEEPIKVAPDLGKEIQAFANPPEEQIVFCYQILINSLPEKLYHENLVSLDKWLKEPWVPRIWVSYADTKCFIIQKELPLKKVVEENKPQKDQNLKKPRDTMMSKISQISRKTRSQSSISLPRSSRSPSIIPSSPKSNNTSVKVKRRNQLLNNQAEKMLALTNVEFAEEVAVQDEYGDDELITKDDPKKEELEETHEEIKQLDFYYKELESLFIPKTGRRAVQTVIVGGHRKDEENNDKVFRATKVFFNHTMKEELDQLDTTINKKTHTEDFQRTNAALVSKKNRIISDRDIEGVEYVARTDSKDRVPRVESTDVSELNVENSLVENSSVENLEEESSEAIDRDFGSLNIESQEVIGVLDKSSVSLNSSSIKKQPRENSRRISDLTVNFSVNGDLRSSQSPKSFRSPKALSKSVNLSLTTNQMRDMYSQRITK